MKKLVTIGLVLAMLLTMVACSSSTPEKSSDTSTQGTETEVNSDTASGDVVTTVKLALWDYDADGSEFPGIIAAFEEANPDIKVEVISSANADYETKITTILAGGDNVDVYFGKSNTQYPTLVLNEYAMDLTDLIAEKGYDTTAYGTVLKQHYEIDGGLYALPYRTNDWVIFYNKTLFDQAGVDYPTNDMTWEEIAEVAKAVTKDNNFGMGFIPKAGFITPVLVGAEDGFDIKTSDFSALEAPLQYMLNLMNEDKSYEDYAQSQSMSQDQTYFYKGTTGMLYNGSWFTQMLTANADSIDFEWGIIKSPYWEGTTKKGFATSTPILINSKTEKVEEAWRLLTFLTGEEGAKLVAKQNLVPGYLSDEVMEIFYTSSGIDENSKQALTENVTYALGEASTLLGVLSSAINEEVDLVMTNNQTPSEAVVNMEKRRQEVLETNK